MKQLFALLALIPLGANATIIYNNGGPLDGGTTVASDLDMLFDPLPAGSADFCDDVNAPCFQEAADDPPHSNPKINFYSQAPDAQSHAAGVAPTRHS